MGIGPVFAMPPPARTRFGLKIDDVGLWELNEAFAVQVIYCQRQARHSGRSGSTSTAAPSRSAIPTACTGARLTGHALIEGKRRGVKPCRRDDVRRRRDGRGGLIRGPLN